MYFDIIYLFNLLSSVLKEKKKKLWFGWDAPPRRVSPSLWRGKKNSEKKKKEEKLKKRSKKEVCHTLAPPFTARVG